MDPIKRLTDAWLEMRHDLREFLRRRAPADRVDDLEQDTWLRLRERGEASRWRSTRAVAFTTARHLAIDAARRERTARNAARSSGGDGAHAGDPSEPSVQIDHSELIARISQALQTLPRPCREAFLMNRLDGLTHAEIARRLGVSTKSVQRYVERALSLCLEIAEP